MRSCSVAARKIDAQREVEAGGGVVGGAELAVEGAFGDPGRVLEDRAEMADELGAVHLGGDEIGRLVGMMLGPVAGDVDAAGEPDLVLGSDVVEEALEAGEAAGHADEPAVEADAHHLGRAEAALLVEGVEGVLEELEEFLAIVEARRR